MGLKTVRKEQVDVNEERANKGSRCMAVSYAHGVKSTCGDNPSPTECKHAHRCIHQCRLQLPPQPGCHIMQMPSQETLT